VGKIAEATVNAGIRALVVCFEPTSGSKSKPFIRNTYEVHGPLRTSETS